MSVSLPGSSTKRAPGMRLATARRSRCQSGGSHIDATRAWAPAPRARPTPRLYASPTRFVREPPRGCSTVAERGPTTGAGPDHARPAGCRLANSASSGARALTAVAAQPTIHEPPETTTAYGSRSVTGRAADTSPRRPPPQGRASGRRAWLAPNRPRRAQQEDHRRAFRRSRPRSQESDRTRPDHEGRRRSPSRIRPTSP